MKKEFLPYDTVRNNALKLAYRICRDGFIPDIIYASLRGGAYMGNVISEFLKLIRPSNRPVFYAAIVARSYTEIGQAEKIKVEGWTYNPDALRVGDKILLVDDIFDSGNTINLLSEIIMSKGIPRSDLKIVVHDYKYFLNKTEQLPVQPDYWCRKHELASHEDDVWIHYLSHELIGLDEKELEEQYYSQDGELREVLGLIHKLKK